jgi:hypothetical protein
VKFESKLLPEIIQFIAYQKIRNFHVLVNKSCIYHEGSKARKEKIRSRGKRLQMGVSKVGKGAPILSVALGVVGQDIRWPSVGLRLQSVFGVEIQHTWAMSVGVRPLFSPRRDGTYQYLVQTVKERTKCYVYQMEDVRLDRRGIKYSM